jgi:hypothetical protein
MSSWGIVFLGVAAALHRVFRHVAATSMREVAAGHLFSSLCADDLRFSAVRAQVSGMKPGVFATPRARMRTACPPARLQRSAPRARAPGRRRGAGRHGRGQAHELSLWGYLPWRGYRTAPRFRTMAAAFTREVAASHLFSSRRASDLP